MEAAFEHALDCLACPRTSTYAPRAGADSMTRNSFGAARFDRLPRLVELLLFLVLCALVAWWAMQMMRGDAIAVPPRADIANAVGAGDRIEQVLASARLFGARRPGTLSDNVRALGIVADGGGNGSVIVSVDGQAARPYRVGDTIDGRVVTAIRAGEIELEINGARQVFRLPPMRAGAPGMTAASASTAPLGGYATAPAAPIPAAAPRAPAYPYGR